MRKKVAKIIKARGRLYGVSEKRLKSVYLRTPARERQELLRQWLRDIMLRTPSPNA